MVVYSNHIREFGKEFSWNLENTNLYDLKKLIGEYNNVHDFDKNNRVFKTYSWIWKTVYEILEDVHKNSKTYREFEKLSPNFF